MSSAEEAHRGQTMQCPHCGKVMVVPRAPGAATPVAAPPGAAPSCAPTAAAASATAPRREPRRDVPTKRCSDCRQSVPEDELVRQGSARICSACVAKGRAVLRKRSSARTPLWIGLGGLAVTAIALVLYAGSRKGSAPASPATPARTVAEASKAPEKATRAGKPAAAPATPAAPLTSSDIVKASDASVALIRLPNSSGSGFIVADGLLATNAHVVSDGFVEEIEVAYPGGSARKRAPRRVVAYDERRDLAILDVETPGRPLVLAARTALPRGEPLLIIGSPGLVGDLVQPNSVTQGMVGGWTEIEKERYLQISGSINPGNSGGPVFAPDGEVIAVATLKIRDKEGIAFGIPSMDVLSTLRGVQKATPAQLDAADARHRAFVAIQRMYEFGLRGVDMMAVNLGALEVAEKKKISSAAALSAAEEMIRDPLQRAVQCLGSYSLDRNLELLRAAAALTPEVRADIVRLREVVASVHDHLSKPSGTAEKYEEALLSCRSHVRGLSDRLSAALDLKLPDPSDVR
jgi:S1-C subfamily serine protease